MPIGQPLRYNPFDQPRRPDRPPPQPRIRYGLDAAGNIQVLADDEPPRAMWGQDGYRDPDRPILADQPQEAIPVVPTPKKAPFYNWKLIDALPRLSAKDAKGEIGIEIECEGTHLFNAPIQYWGCHTDGSLRDTAGHPPVEYVLKKPLPRSEIPDALTYLTSKLKQANSKVNDSHRSSVHVHVNCQQMTVKEIVNFICLYLFFEHALVEFSGQERVGNLFCLRAKDAQYWVRNIVQGLRDGNFANVYHEAYRYTSCNTASLAKFGSLEFRSMRGTVDQALIQSWVDLLCLIRDRSAEFSDPLKMYEKYSTMEPMEFFSYIFRPKPDLQRLLSTTACLESGMNEGSIFVRDIAYAIEEWSDVKPEPKPKPVPGDNPWVRLMHPRPRGAMGRVARLAEAKAEGWYATNSSTPGGRNKVFLDPMGDMHEVFVEYRNRLCYDSYGLIGRYDDNTEEVQEWFVES